MLEQTRKQHGIRNDNIVVTTKIEHSMDLTKFIENIQMPKEINRFWVGYSGGLDSTVLLHLLFSALKNKSAPDLHAIHINHHLSPQANQWERHCRHVCQQWNIPLTIVAVDAKPEQGESPEAKARTERYQAFATLLKNNDCLVTAHHQDDQIETLFLQLFRGAGPRGLAAMPMVKQFHRGYLWRPLLSITREELKGYAVYHDLSWIDDESNFDTSFDRNYVRHQLMPLILQRWPGVKTTLPRVSQQCAKANVVLQEMAQMDFAACYNETHNTLFISKLKTLSSERQENLLRYWLEYLDFSLPSQLRLNEIENTILNARADATPLLQWDNLEIRRYRDELYVMLPLIKHDPKLIIPWDGKKMIKLPDNLGIISPKLLKAWHVLLSSKAKFTIRFRQGGEKIKLPYRAGHHELKKLLQEWGIPPWLRDRIPLIFSENELLALGIDPFQKHRLS